MGYRFYPPGEIEKMLPLLRARFLFDTAWHWPRFVVRYRPWDWARDGL